MNNLTIDPNDIINDIKVKLTKDQCYDIGNKNQWIRKCPECKSDIISNDKWYCKDADKKKRLCKYCRIKGNRNPNYGKKVSDDIKIKCRNTYKDNNHIPYWVGKYLTDDHKQKIAISKKGTYPSKYQLERVKQVNAGNTYRKGKLHNDNSKRKMRIAKAYYIMRNVGHKICPAFSEIACEYFDWLNKWNGWNGKYATNGGEYFIKELGYWVDYYEPKENIIIEWDEYHHYSHGNLLLKDIKRMEEIKQHLTCRFFRYNQKTNELKEW